MGARAQVPVIDLLPSFKSVSMQERNALFLPDDGHWNKEGHRVAASVVAKELIKENIIGNTVERGHLSMPQL